MTKDVVGVCCVGGTEISGTAGTPNLGVDKGGPTTGTNEAGKRAALGFAALP